MRGTEVIALFEKYGLSAHDIASAVYNGLYPDYFGIRLKPFNCLTCEYAEPGKRPNDPGVCRNHSEHQAVAGISYCPHTPGGVPNAMIPEDGIEGTCKYGYVVLRDIDFFERLKGCEFVRAEVEEYFDDLLPGINRTAINPRPVIAEQVIEPEPEDAEIASNPKRNRKREKISICTKPGTIWPQIKIRIVNNVRLEITVNREMAPYDPKDLGFNPARQGDVTMWEILRLFALKHGSLPLASKDTVIGKYNITNFRKLLKSIFPDISGEPVQRWHRKRGYQCEFEISASEHYINENDGTPDNGDMGEDYADLIANKRS